MTYEAILVAVLAIVITIVVFLVRRLLSSGKRYVLLTGLNDTGKTLIYSQLVYNRHVATFTSSQDNEGQFNTQKNFVTLVDLPVFHSIRQQFFEKYKASSKGIVYVVDSVTLAQNVRDAANVLYNILIDPAVVKNRPQLLILCNKQNQTLAKGCTVIKSMLEKELNTLGYLATLKSYCG
ncbi:signal recognition particle receptor subunit beta [Dendroctonus ponderosae]|nr:signal recognition particle receptor subunit beta [Dendroctonus ponderosae]